MVIKLLNGEHQLEERPCCSNAHLYNISQNVSYSSKRKFALLSLAYQVVHLHSLISGDIPPEQFILKVLSILRG